MVTNEKHPARLVKFKKNDQHLKDALTNGTLYFSSVEGLNDPHEGIFRFHLGNDYESFKKFYLGDYGGNSKLLEHHYKNIKEFEENLNKAFNWRYINNGICCFSDETTIINTLMWSHYADRHTGVCLVFKTDGLKFYPVENNVDGTYISGAFTASKVNYTETYINQNPLNKELNQKSFLTTKYIDWSYEKEYRYVGATPGNHYFPKDRLVDIIFGAKMSHESKNEIKNIVNEKYNNISFKKVIIPNNNFELIVTED